MKRRHKKSEQIKKKNKENEIFCWGEFFLNINKGIKTKETRCFSKKVLITKKNSAVFFEDLAWKTNFTRKTSF